MKYDTTIVNASVWIGGQWERKTICVKNGLVQDLNDACPDARETLDAAERFVVPGLIDSHVHMRSLDPGDARSDDFFSGSLAAIRGGVTTIIDFTAEASCADEVDHVFAQRRQDAAGSLVDYGFHNSFAKPREVPEMVRRGLAHGMPTIKMYTTYRFASDDRQIAETLRRSADGDIMLNCHVENNNLVEASVKEMTRFSRRRPELCELSEAAKLAEMTAFTGGRLHIVHVSCGDTVEMLRRRFPDLLGRHVLLESCPHYFVFDESVYASPDARLFSMTPPLRGARQREGLCRNFDAIATISTDHCPFDRARKQGEADDLPSGIGGLGYAFAQMYRIFGDAVIDRFTVNQALIHGLNAKGAISPGMDADLAVFRKTPPARVSDLRGGCDYSVYSGCEETLAFEHVMRRGEWLMRDGEIRTGAEKGRYIARCLN